MPSPSLLLPLCNPRACGAAAVGLSLGFVLTAACVRACVTCVCLRTWWCVCVCACMCVLLRWLQWLSINAVCPLCKTPTTDVIHALRRTPVPGLRSGQHAVADEAQAASRATLARGRHPAALRRRRGFSSEADRRRHLKHRPVPSQRQFTHGQRHDSSVTSPCSEHELRRKWRRSVYQRGRWALPLRGHGVVRPAEVSRAATMPAVGTCCLACT